MSRASTTTRYSILESKDADRPSDENIEKMYVKVLEQLLTPPHVKEQLINTQTIDQKWKLVQVHKDIFKDTKQSEQWSAKETALLNAIEKSPDVKNISNLKVILTSANLDVMQMFLSNRGISILMKAIDEKITKKHLTEIDVAILFEIMLCFKLIMNNHVGMEGFLAVNGCIDTIAKCLTFKYKFFALEILEILSACCYSEASTDMVIHGMRVLARNNKEPPFVCLGTALRNEDIEVKTAVMRFVNAMTMGADFDGFTSLRGDLTAQLFIETLNEVVQAVDSELNILEDRGFISRNETGAVANAVAAMHSSSGEEKDQRALRESFAKQKSWSKQDSLDLPNLYGNKQQKLKRLQSVGLDELDELGTTSETSHNLTVNTGGKTVRVNPSEGTMAGVLMTVFVTKSCMGTKIRVDRKYFELLNGVLRNYPGTDSSYPLENEIQISNIVEIRAHTTHRKVLKTCETFNYESFEVVTNTNLVLSVCCESKLDKENWLLAIKNCRDEIIISKSAYKMVIHDLTPKHVLKNANAFKKLGNDYKKFTIEQQKFSLEHCGIDVSNVKEVFKFLEKETYASGFSNKLLSILLELMLIPAGSEATWDTILEGMRKLKRVHLQETDALESAEAFHELSFIELLQWKADESGSGYKHVNKLALSSLQAEQTIADLTAKVAELEKKKKELTRYKIINSFKTMAAGDLEINRLTSRAKLLESSIEEKDKEIADLKSQLEKLGDDHERLKAAPPKIVVASAGTVVAAASNERYEKFEKMRKMLPEGAVRQKMALEKFTPEEIDYFIANGTPAASAAPVAAAAPAAAASNERYEKFEKMRKMLPEGAVRQKMALEKFTPEEIDYFIANGTPATAAAPVATADAAVAPAAAAANERYAKFERMRKMLPEGAVRQKMMTEGFTPAEIDAFFSGEAPPAAAAAPAPAAAAPAVDERYAKFDRMRKMLPEGAVRQKMATEGFKPEEIDNYFANGPPAAGAANAAAAAPAATAATDEKYAKYDKMKKSLPEGAVRHKMTADGLSAAEIDAYFGVAPAAGGAGLAKVAGVVGALGAMKKPTVEVPPENMPAKPVMKPEVKLKNLFWNKIPADNIKGTLWYQLTEFQIDKDDRKRMEEEFAAKDTKVLTSNPSFSTKGKGDNSPSGGSGAATPAAPKLVSVLDSKRVQNLLIVMGRLRKSPEEIMNICVELDTTVLTADLTATIKTILPTPEENQAVAGYMEINKSPDNLDNASKLYYHFSRVPRFNARIECHEIAYLWHASALTTSNQLVIIKKACGELVHSQNYMQILLSMILAIGNYINGDTKFGQAYGVKLDTFMKLSTLKAGTGQGTLMNYLAALAERHSPELMQFSEDWFGIWAAAELSLRDIKNDMNVLQKQVDKMNNEFLKIKDGKENPGIDGVLEDSRGPCTSPLYRRLDSFLHEGKSKMAYLQTMCTEIENSMEGLMARYGENFKAVSDEDNCKKFFTTISAFAKGFRAAMDENIKKRVAQEKAARLANEANKRLEAKRLAAEQKAAAEGKPVRKTVSIDPAATGGSSSPPASPTPTAKKGTATASHNIFDKFHSAQDDSTEAVIAKFRMKLHKSQRLQPQDIFEHKE